MGVASAAINKSFSNKKDWNLCLFLTQLGLAMA
jgi:hypothetical protein